jgi:hypothetical protein
MKNCRAKASDLAGQANLPERFFYQGGISGSLLLLLGSCVPCCLWGIRVDPGRDIEFFICTSQMLGKIQRNY